MQAPANLYDLAAGLLFYPGADYREQVEQYRREYVAALPEAADLVTAFADAVERLAPEELEELFTRTFELNPMCAPEVGWHLFGENYSRGEFLVQMRKGLRQHGLPETTELPDHLGHVLSVLGRSAPGESGPFVERYILPALDKMLTELSGKENPYEGLLKAVRRLAAEHRVLAEPEVEHE